MKNKVFILVVTVLFTCMSFGSVYGVEVATVEKADGGDLCSADFEKFCSDITDPEDNMDEVVKCLKRHKRELSHGCGDMLDRIEHMKKGMIKVKKKRLK